MGKFATMEEASAFHDSPGDQGDSVEARHGRGASKRRRTRTAVRRGSRRHRVVIVVCEARSRERSLGEEHMATFDALIDDLGSRFGLGANARTLIREVLALIAGSPGGLGGFLDTFKSAGLSSEVAAWLGRPDAAPLTAQQVER